MNNVTNNNHLFKLSSINGLGNFLIITDLKGEIQLFNVTFSQLCNSANRDALLLSNQLSMKNFFSPEVGTMAEIIKTLQEKNEWEGILNFLLDYNLKLPIKAKAQLLNPEPSSKLNILFSFELESFESIEVDPLAQKEFTPKNKSLKPIDEENEISLIESYAELRRIKEDLISSVSHELRTPLASIVGFSETIKNDPHLPENLRNEFIDIILNESKRLASLINNLLEISEIEKANIEFHKAPTLINSILEKVKNEFNTQAKEKNISLNISTPLSPITAFVSEDKIHQLFSNLISNAIKFTPNGGKVEVELKEDEDNFSFTVKDNGIGIPKKDLRKIFTKFYRVHRPGFEYRGTGIGLAICHYIVRIHNGEIFVESQENKGSTFKVIIPKHYEK